VRARRATRRGTIVGAISGLALCLASSASAAFPGGDGRIFFETRAMAGNPVIASMDPNGTDRTPLVGGQDPSVSANAQLVAFIRGGNVWIATRDGGFQRQITDTDAVERSPAFSPNGRSIVFSTEISGRNGRVGERGNIVRIQTDGTDRRKLTDTGIVVRDPSFSPDGNKIVFERTGSDATPQIWKMAADGADPTPLTDAKVPSESPSWSPNGEKIAFERSDGRRSQIFSIGSGGAGLRQVTSFTDRNSRSPRWSPSGDRIVLWQDLLGEGPSGIFTIDRDGGGLRRLTSKGPGDPATFNPFWAPVATTPGA
jgi:TolB protein